MPVLTVGDPLPEFPVVRAPEVEERAFAPLPAIDRAAVVDHLV